MSEFHFHGVEEDCVNILADLQQLGGYSIFADLNYPTRVPHNLSGIAPANVLKRLPNRRLFLAGPSVATPLRLHGSDGGKFFIHQDYIPDLMGLTLGRTARVDGYTRLGISSVDHARSYYTPDCRPVPPTQDLKRDYAEVVKMIRRRCQRVRIDHYLWVGRRALDLPDRSRVLVLDYGKLFDLDGFFVRSNLAAGSAGAKQHEEQYGNRRRTPIGAANLAPLHR